MYTFLQILELFGKEPAVQVSAVSEFGKFSNSEHHPILKNTVATNKTKNIRILVKTVSPNEVHVYR